jgi:peptidyl-prolyl cis-trans isomerase B (cyclophilin B)
VAGKKERQRKLARERYARQAERRAQRSHKARIRAIAAGGVCALAAVGVGAYFLAGTSGGKSAAASAAASASPSPSASPSSTASPAAVAVAEPAHHCTYATSGTAARKVSLPPSSPNYTASYQAAIATNRGTIVINLLNSKATCTVNSFVHLTEQKYFDNTKCVRLTTSSIYVLQCGDPTGTDTGGPGYEFASENLKGATYPAGTVAMANTGQPDSNGSQFFLVYRNTPLPPSYTPFGTITQGLPILDAIAKAGSDNANAPGDGHPKENVVIDTITIKQT